MSNSHGVHEAQNGQEPSITHMLQCVQESPNGQEPSINNMPVNTYLAKS